MVLVVSDRTTAGALERAKAADVPTHILEDPAEGRSLIEVLQATRVDLVVLAGYLKLVPPVVVQAYAGRMINLHPALLPAFGGKNMYGARVHQAVLASGASISGATVHLVSEEYDRGPIVAQWPVPVLSGDTPETLEARVRAVEYQLLPAVVHAAASAGRVVRLVVEEPAFAPSRSAGSVAQALRAVQRQRRGESSCHEP